MQASLRFSSKANLDLENIEAFENNVLAGRGNRIASVLYTQLGILRSSIRLGMKEEAINGLETHRLSLGRYDCYYQIETERSVVVIAIFDTRQDPDKLKL